MKVRIEQTYREEMPWKYEQERIDKEKKKMAEVDAAIEAEDDARDKAIQEA